MDVYAGNRRSYDQKEVVKICSYYNDLADRRLHWENHWQEVADHSLGRRDFIVGREPGRQRQVRIYDTTSRDANNLLAAALHSLLTNPATKWFDLRFRNDELNDMDEAMGWLHAVRELMIGAFQSPNAAFATQMHELYADLTAFGSAMLYVQDEPGEGIRFQARPLQEVFIDEDAMGRTSVTFRKFTLKNWQAVDAFGRDAVPAVADLIDKDNGQHNQTKEYLHLVRKNELPLPGRIDAQGMPWESIYISLDEKKVISQGGYWENPFMVARWSVDAGELYGRGPGIDSLPDQKLLNAIWRTYIRNAEKAADPPLLVDDDGVMPGSQLRITPSAMITVRNDGGAREPVRYLEHRGRFDISEAVVETRTRKVEKAFHSEIIQAFQDPRMTATQVLELARLSQRILSPVLGRMQVELLEPMIERVYGIISRSGGFPPPPSVIEGQDIQVDYVSPVARAQKASDSQAILDSFQAAAAVAQLEPGVMDNVNLDEAIRQVFSGNGVSPNIMRSRGEVLKIRQAQAAMMQQQQQQQQQLQEVDALSKAVPAAAKGAEVIQQQAGPPA